VILRVIYFSIKIPRPPSFALYDIADVVCMLFVHGNTLPFAIKLEFSSFRRTNFKISYTLPIFPRIPEPLGLKLLCHFLFCPWILLEQAIHASSFPVSFESLFSFQSQFHSNFFATSIMLYHSSFSPYDKSNCYSVLNFPYSSLLWPLFQ